MAESPDLGVDDHPCEVFGYEGLFCIDSSAIPTSLGVNPSLTISAVCERGAEQLVRAGGRPRPAGAAGGLAPQGAAEIVGERVVVPVPRPPRKRKRPAKRRAAPRRRALR